MIDCHEREKSPSQACTVGNPAVIGMKPLDRKLCVPAFRRVCHYRVALLWTAVHPRVAAVLSLGTRSQLRIREYLRSGCEKP
jgi:hypothetical protein